MMTKLCIVFDIDGTLFDTKRGIIKALNEVLDNYGKGSITSSKEDYYIGPPIKNSLIEYQGFNEKDANEATALYRSIYVKKYIQDSNLYIGIEDVLKKLRDWKVVVGIATMKTLPQIDKLFKIFGLYEYFDIIESAKEDGSLSKSQMLINIRKTFPCIQKFVMVGDTSGDYNAASVAGYEFIAVDYGYGNIQELEVTHINEALELVALFEKICR